MVVFCYGPAGGNANVDNVNNDGNVNNNNVNNTNRLRPDSWLFPV